MNDNSILTCIFGRVEGLAAASSADVNFAPLRAAIRSLQFASLKLDAEKHVAERVLRGHLRKWRKEHKRKYGYPERFIRLIKDLFTEESNDVAESTPQIADELGLSSLPDFELGNDHEVDIIAQNWPRLPLPRRPKHPDSLPPKLIEALKVVRKINQKLVSFERGFIHEDGIKDREWYRHLGVAPGKWLGKTSVHVRLKNCSNIFCLQDTAPRRCQLSLRQSRLRITSRLQTTRLSV